VIGAYLLLVLVVFLVLRAPATEPWVPAFLGTVVLIFLLRYLSTSYRIDAEYVRAWRILGGQKMRLKEVRRIEFANLRDLSATGFFGAWGWRGRMWSPRIGRFDSIHTDSGGLLISGASYPMFISPEDPTEFAQELSRRVRSVSASLSATANEGLVSGAAPPS
jgi:PH (Pleckstrin Homology) domain-containing protein